MDRRWERRIPTEKVSRWQIFVIGNLDDFFIIQRTNTKMTREAPEVRSDKRKPG